MQQSAFPRFLRALRQTLRRLGSGAARSRGWHAAFEELPAASRACRHQLTGEIAARTCERAFDCRHCAEHLRLEARREQRLGAARAMRGRPAIGFDPSRRFYHRGHTWVRLERNGTATVGVDGLARRVLGTPTKVALPASGTRLVVNGPFAHVRTRGRSVSLVSPVDGIVLGVRGEGTRFRLRVRPDAFLDLRHLLTGHEVKAWAASELDRLQSALGSAGAPAALADGGELAADVGVVLPPERYDVLLAETFLQV